MTVGKKKNFIRSIHCVTITINKTFQTDAIKVDQTNFLFGKPSVKTSRFIKNTRKIKI